MSYLVPVFHSEDLEDGDDGPKQVVKVRSRNFCSRIPVVTRVCGMEPAVSAVLHVCWERGGKVPWVRWQQGVTSDWVKVEAVGKELEAEQGEDKHEQ